MKNQKGFGTFEFLALLPLLLSVIALIAGASLLFKADSHLKHECRVSVLNSQRSVAQKLRSLIKMNPRAAALRAEYQSAKVAEIAASVFPLTLALAKANTARVQIVRGIFAAQQQALIVQGRALSYAAALRGKSAVMQGLAKEAHENRLTVPLARSSSRWGRYPLTATPEGNLTPDYNPSLNFSKDQVVDVDVTVDVGSLLPDWLRNLLPNHGLEINSHCQATIEKQEDAWIETLNAVK